MAVPEYILTQDIGSFSCKATLFSLDGTVVRSNAVSYRPCYNDQGWAWQSPHLWWDAFRTNCRTVLTGISPDSVKAVCLCGQMMSCLPVDEKIQPLFDCVIWDDKRSIRETEEIHTLLGAPEIHKITGVCLSHTFSLSKILWLKRHHPDVYQRTYKFIQCMDYINYLLTGRLITDNTNAGFTQMYDLFQQKWSDQILQATGVDPDKLPEVVPFGTILAPVLPQAASQCGLSTSTQVVLGLGDGRATVVGSGIQTPGEGCIYLGASSWLSQVTLGRELDTQNAITKADYLPDTYVNGGAMLAGRMCADWYVNAFFPDRPHTQDLSDLDRFLFSQVPKSPVGSNGLLFMPYLRGERAPWWNHYAKGGFVGLCSHHTKYDFFRSILEGVSFHIGLIKNRIERMESFSSMRLVGSGSSPQWQQILSDVFEMEISSSDVTGNVACVGAAVVAGVAIGAYKDYSEITRFHHNQRITIPIAENIEIYRELLPAFEDCYYALQDINQHLSQVNYSKHNKP